MKSVLSKLFSMDNKAELLTLISKSLELKLINGNFMTTKWRSFTMHWHWQKVLWLKKQHRKWYTVSPFEGFHNAHLTLQRLYMWDIKHCREIGILYSFLTGCIHKTNSTQASHPSTISRYKELHSILNSWLQTEHEKINPKLYTIMWHWSQNSSIVIHKCAKSVG